MAKILVSGWVTGLLVGCGSAASEEEVTPDKTQSPDLTDTIQGGTMYDCQSGSFCEIFTPKHYDQFFPRAASPYSYAGLVEAADTYYPTFAQTGGLEMRKREAAAFLANIAHESGSLQHAEELICANGAWLTNSACDVYGASGKSYHGRGAIQLTWQDNYRAASDAMGVDLVANPDLVAEDPKLAIGTAIWFWMDQGRCHEALVGGAGFGATVRAINGIECTSTERQRIQQWEARVTLFKRFAAAFEIDPGDLSGCR